MPCVTTKDKYLLHLFSIKPGVVTYKEKISNNKVKIILNLQDNTRKGLSGVHGIQNYILLVINEI